MILSPPGFLRGQHYTAFVGDVERLVRATGKGLAAERLLLELIAATEAVAAIDHQGVASWYYEQLANVYHRRRDLAAEQAILVRFRVQRAVPGPLRRALLARLRALEAALARTRPSAPASASQPGPPVRTCALAGCDIELTATQTTYCSLPHAQFAGAARLRRLRR